MYSQSYSFSGMTASVWKITKITTIYKLRKPLRDIGVND